ncbi:MAG TPA: NAD(P)-dependent oxidoreductase, partial [Clostridia bacterium]|nr:NAD(P)-dependent oxidoreductase [Clostridia bacterium]
RYMIDKKALSLMKPTSYLINTARGALINEEDLAEALRNGTIKGAGLDVMVSEPPKKDNPLLKLDNCLITPHIAWATKEARQRLLSILCGNIKAFLNGNPVNLV